MKKKDWLVSISIGCVLGLLTIFSTTAQHLFSLPEKVQAAENTASELSSNDEPTFENDVDQILRLTLNSHTTWKTVQGEAKMTWHLKDGAQWNNTRFTIAQPGSAHLELVDSSDKNAQLLWISNGIQIFSLDGQNRTYTAASLPAFTQNLSLLPVSLADISSEAIYHHPFALVIPSPVAEYVFPQWFAQGQADASYALVGSDEVLGRKVWMVDYLTPYDHTVSWLDQQTGMILRYIQETEGTKFFEFEMLSLSFDAEVNADLFTIPDGYSVTTETEH